MKISKKSSGREKRILTAMIVDNIVLGRISSKWSGNMFRNKWANIIAGWCLKYYNKYQKAPLQYIETLFEHWAEKSKDKNNVELVEKFLVTLSDEYEELQSESNSDYILDISGEYFNEVQIERLLEETQSEIDVSNVSNAHQRLAAYNQIELGVGEGVNLLQDKEATIEAFKSKEEPLITYPGALGEFFGDTLERDGFISFMGPEKRGKSFWLIDVAYRGMLQRRKVAFFEAGDMSKNQIMRRLLTRVAKRPMHTKTYYVPNKIRVREGKPRIKQDTKKCDKNLSWQRAWKAGKKVMKRKIRSGESYFKLSCHPNSTLTVKKIISILQEWERGGWVPDVIAVDYVDILNMTYYGLEGRDCINETWKQLRALSQRYHCLVVTATQTDSASYTKEIIGMTNFSEDKRKLSHVTGMIGINCTMEEKDKDIRRLNWVVKRESSYNDYKCVYVAGCLDICNPAIKSSF